MLPSTLCICLGISKLKDQPCGACRFFLRLRLVVFMIEYDKVGFSISFPSVLCVRKSRLQRSLGQQFYCASYFCLSIHISKCSSKLLIMTEWLCLECINTSIIWGGSLWKAKCLSDRLLYCSSHFTDFPAVKERI